MNKGNKLIAAFILLIFFNCKRDVHIIYGIDEMSFLNNSILTSVEQEYEKFNRNKHCRDTLNTYFDNFVIDLHVEKSDTIFFINLKNYFFKQYYLLNKYNEIGWNISASTEYLGSPKLLGNKKYTFFENSYAPNSDTSKVIDTLMLNTTKKSDSQFLICSKAHGNYIILSLEPKYDFYNIYIDKLGKWKCYYRRYRDCSSAE